MSYEDSIFSGSSGPPKGERPKLKLKPRSSPAELAKAAAASTTTKKEKSNPFGNARPREDVLKEKGIDVKKMDESLDKRVEKMAPRTRQQDEELKACEQLLEMAEGSLKSADEKDDDYNDKQKEVEKAKKELDAMIESFKQVATTERPVFTRPSERERNREEGGGGGYNDRGGDFSNFSNNRRNDDGGGDSRGGDFSNFGGRDRDGGSGGGDYGRGGGDFSNFGGRDRGSGGGGGGSSSGAKIYVGNLSYSTDENQLGQEFSRFGEIVDLYLAMDRETGQPKGFAFITFKTPEDAQKAVDNMDQHNLDGRQLRVNVDTPSGGGGGGGGYGGGEKY